MRSWRNPHTKSMPMWKIRRDFPPPRGKLLIGRLCEYSVANALSRVKPRSLFHGGVDWFHPATFDLASVLWLNVLSQFCTTGVSPHCELFAVLFGGTIVRINRAEWRKINPRKFVMFSICFRGKFHVNFWDSALVRFLIHIEFRRVRRNVSIKSTRTTFVNFRIRFWFVLYI